MHVLRMMEGFDRSIGLPPPCRRISPTPLRPYRAGNGQRTSMQMQVQICQTTSRAPLQVYKSGPAIGLCLFTHHPSIPTANVPAVRLLAWGPCAQYRSVCGLAAGRLISEKQSRANQFACEIGRVGYNKTMVDCSATALRQIARAGAARSPPMCASLSYYTETSGLEPSRKTFYRGCKEGLA
jgi:hypothetical protein